MYAASASKPVASVSAQQIIDHVGASRGMQGFLKWAEAALPASVSVALIQRAASNPKLSGLGSTRQMFRGIGALATLGDDSLSDSSDADIAAAEAYANATTPTASQVATNAPASSSWVSQIAPVLTSAVSAAGQAYLTVNQVNAANQILQTNLQRAQQGLPPLPYTPAQLGLTGPTVNFGLSSETMTPLLLVGGVVLFAILASKGSKKS